MLATGQATIGARFVTRKRLDEPARLAQAGTRVNAPVSRRTGSRLRGDERRRPRQSQPSPFLRRSPCEHLARPAHLLGIDLILVGEVEQERLVPNQVVEHAQEKIRLAGGFADGVGPDPGERQEAAKPLWFAGNEAQGRDANSGCRMLPFLRITGSRPPRWRHW